MSIQQVISDTAKISPHCQLGFGVVIGPHVVIEEGCVIGPHVHIEEGAHLGAHCKIGAYTQIRRKAKIGAHTNIRARTVIGSEGFGYAQNQKLESESIPQLGSVTIGEKSDIGSLTAIDRGAFFDTYLGPQGSIGPFSHVAHNLHIQNDFHADDRFVVAGSTKIGSHVTFKERVSVTGHISIQDQVTIESSSRVTKKIKQSGHFQGSPPRELKEFQELQKSLKEIFLYAQEIQDHFKGVK